MTMQKIKWKNFNGTESACDSLYSNPSYEDSFKFKTINDEIFTGNIAWEQGRNNNYRFYVGEHGSSQIYFPEQVTHIEEK